MATISQRQLNRTFLERQFLLERTDRSAVEVIAQLLALQSQAANSPYEALWARVSGFSPTDLDRLYSDRSVVRGTWFRSTVQTTTAEDYLAFRGLHSELFLRAMDQHIPGAPGLGWVEELRAHYSRAGSLTGPELVALAHGLFPDTAVDSWKQHSVRRAVPLLRYPKGPGGRTLGPRDPWIEVEGHLGELPLAAGSVDSAELIRRYLAAYGPATPADASNFLGLPRLGPIFRSMGLVEHHTEAGVLLYDTPEGTLTPEDAEAPPRLMASFDHSILGHADRTRIIDRGLSPILSGVNAVFKPFILVDGRVTGYWSYGLSKGIPAVKLRYFSRPTASQEQDLLSEAGSWAESWFGTQEGLSFDIGDHS